ncbi:MAG: LTA synthase family protein [Oscillospiraceae bacterium]|nr:LTA synthase family protein [Oscillospiraceae bacterium]
MPTLKIKNPLPSLLLTAVLLVAAGCCLGLVSLYFSAGSHGLDLFLWYLTQPTVLVLNLLPFVLLTLLLYALFDRAWLAFLVSGGVGLFFSWAQYWKLMARSDPIYAGDLLLLSEATQMAGQYIQITWQIVLSAVLVLIGCAVLFFLGQGRMKKALPRLSLLALIVAAGMWLYPSFYTDSATYNSMTVWPQVNKWFETNRYISRGGIYPFLHSIPDALPQPPEGYDREAAESLLANSPSADIPEEERVSIILTQLEAFADLSGITDRITGHDPYAIFHALAEESYHGQLLPNVFAGGTIDTERCVLTGYSALEDFRHSAWSYARYFAEQGYALNGAHAGYEAFYNRLNVNANLGISNYRFIEGYYDALYGAVPPDDFFLQDITNYCKTQMESGPVFSFNVTYQNHGPYDSSKLWYDTLYVPQGDLSDSDYHIINNYLHGIEKTTIHMQRMVDTFRQSGEPVILVFFGDHKPWLGEQSVTYGALGIEIQSQDIGSFYNYYATPYLIWANDAAKAVLGSDFVGQGPDISPCFLMNVLFEQCGWEGPGFMQLTDAVLAETSVLHATNRYLVDGQLTDTLTESQQKLVQDMLHTQYYLTQDYGGVHP